MYKLISYPIKEGDPSWPNNPSVYLESHTSIDAGDTANTYMIHLFNHYGTHIDGPRHFHKQGIPLEKLPLSRFIYSRPLVLDVPKGAAEKIVPYDLQPYLDDIKTADLLLLRTGFWKYRQERPDVYSTNGPAVSSHLAQFLQDNLGQLKAIALDFVSLASYSDIKDGDLAHQYMLGMYHKNYICIIEDVNMASLPAGFLKSVSAIPLFIEGIDSSPVTMWAEY